MTRTRLAISAAVVAVLLAACGEQTATQTSGTDDGTGSTILATAEATAEEEPTADEEPTPLAETTPSADTSESATYEGDAFSVAYEFPQDWSAEEYVEGLLLLNQDEVAGIYFSLIVAAIDPDDPEGFAVADVELTTEGVAGWLATHPDVDAGEPAEATLGGLSGHVIDLGRVVTGEDQGPADCAPCTPLFWAEEPNDEPMPAISALFGDEQDRIWLLELADGDLITVQVYTDDPADFESFLDDAQPVLDALSIE